MSTVAREVRVHGRVQGVFFRDSCEAEARSRGVDGWVSNEPDGSVAAYFEGTPDAVEALVAWCRKGPAHARVQRLEEREVPPRGETGFTVR
jgi:acylphosphatase